MLYTYFVEEVPTSSEGGHRVCKKASRRRRSKAGHTASYLPIFFTSLRYPDLLSVPISLPSRWEAPTDEGAPKEGARSRWEARKNVAYFLPSEAKHLFLAYFLSPPCFAPTSSEGGEVGKCFASEGRKAREGTVVIQNRFFSCFARRDIRVSKVMLRMEKYNALLAYQVGKGLL